MSDFITLQCPSCGGKLVIAPDASSLMCEHCGTEHMVRRDTNNIFLESYARCPVCNRNDKSEKVTAIIRSQTVHNQFDSQSPITHLARLLTPPSKPLPPDYSAFEYSPHISMALYINIFGVFSILGAVIAIIVHIYDIAKILSRGQDVIILNTIVNIIISIIPAMIWLFLDRVTLPKVKKDNQEWIANANAMREKVKKQYDLEVDHWNYAMYRWNNLYYCSRDDCVFLPGQKTYAPVSQMTDYIFIRQ